MLAEKKYKKKWSVDPQNVTWARDQSKFGFKMLQKMGWTDGKGLGAGEDGVVDPVKAVFKDDSRGLGCTASYDDTWVAHQDDFQSLLNNLNGNDDVNANDTSSNLDLSSMSDNSKGQKKIHYGKFTKGKDLSNYKNEDMDAIFGIKKRKTAKGQEGVPEVTEAVNTKVSKLSMNEYFKQRMAQLKTGKTAPKSEENSESGDTTPQESTETEAIKPKKKDKKSKKRHSKQIETSGENENTEMLEDEPKPKKKKDKKRKKKESSEEPEQMEKVLKDTTCENIESNPEKKNKKKRKRKDEENKSQTEVISTLTKNSDEVEEVPKKKKKKKEKKSKKNDTT